MKKFLLPAFLGLTIALGGCVTPTGGPTKSALEMQALQVREFDCTKDAAYTAIISLFQDLGYVIESTESAAGLVIAKTPSRAETIFGKGTVTTWAKATGFVEPLGAKRVKVRISFVNSEMQTIYGMTGTNDNPVEDAKTYQDAFALLQKAIFIRTNTQ